MLGAVAPEHASTLSPNTVHLECLDANLNPNHAGAETATGPEWEVAHLPLDAARHLAPATGHDAVPRIDELAQQGFMEGWTGPRGE